MAKTSFAEMNCAIAQTLERVGEWWTLLIIRNAFWGMVRFDDFQQHLDVASNVLAARLRKLVKAGIFVRSQSKEDGRSFEYRLTERGLSLYPILVAMTEWGERWFPDAKGPRVRLVERKTGKPVAGIAVTSVSGAPLHPWEIDAMPGKGADKKVYELFAIRTGRPKTKPLRKSPRTKPRRSADQAKHK